MARCAFRYTPRPGGTILAAASLTWSDWPAPRQPARSLVAAGLLIVAVLATAMVDPWLAVVGAVALVISVQEALLPTRYEVGPDGVTVKRPFTRRRAPWSTFSGFREVDEGFVLQGQGSRRFLQARRTVRLRCTADRGVVAGALADHLGAP